jgi:hypothetical protein
VLRQIYSWHDSAHKLLIMKNKGSGYSPLPYRGYTYTSDQKDFMKLDVTFDYYTYNIYLNNETSVPTGATFWMRAVILKGAKGGRIDLSRYEDYENLKKDYNLPN